MSCKSVVGICWLVFFWASTALEPQAQSVEKGTAVTLYGGANGGFFSIYEPVVSGRQLASLRGKSWRN